MTIENLSNQNPTDDEVISALGRTGFILEHRVAQMLRKQEFQVEMNYAYPDSETEKSREIDVSATFEEEIEAGAVSAGITAELVIECKNSPNPLVLIGERGQDALHGDDRVGLTFDPFSLKFSGGKGYYTMLGKLGLDRLPQDASGDQFVGHQLIRMSRQGGTWRADNNSIYDSILYPLVKACRYQLGQFGTDDIRADDPIGWMRYPILWYVLPIVVTAGPVLTVDVTSNEPVVNREGWARLKRTFDRKESFSDFRVDVVSFSHLDNYIASRIIWNIKYASEKLKANINLFNPEWLNANLGEPEREGQIFRAWLESIRAQTN